MVRAGMGPMTGRRMGRCALRHRQNSPAGKRAECPGLGSAAAGLRPRAGWNPARMRQRIRRRTQALPVVNA